MIWDSHILWATLQLFGRPCIGNVLWEGGHQPVPSIIFFLLECFRQQKEKKKDRAAWLLCVHLAQYWRLTEALHSC